MVTGEYILGAATGRAVIGGNQLYFAGSDVDGRDAANSVVSLYTLTPALPAANYGSAVETFDVTGNQALDPAGNDNEVPKRPANVDYGWGGFNPGNNFLNFLQTATPPGVPDIQGVYFGQDTRDPGAHIYTLLDSTSSAAPFNTPGTALNLTEPGAKGSIRAWTSGPTDLALLVRDGDGWYQSSSKSVSVMAVGTQDYNFSGPGAVSWTQVTGPADLDEVDNGGEGPVITAGAGTPDLSNIIGMGAVITAASGPNGANTGLTIEAISLVGPPPASSDSWEAYP